MAKRDTERPGTSMNTDNNPDFMPACRLHATYEHWTRDCWNDAQQYFQPKPNARGRTNDRHDGRDGRGQITSTNWDAYNAAAESAMAMRMIECIAIGKDPFE